MSSSLCFLGYVDMWTSLHMVQPIILKSWVCTLYSRIVRLYDISLPIMKFSCMLLQNCICFKLLWSCTYFQLKKLKSFALVFILYFFRHFNLEKNFPHPEQILSSWCVLWTCNICLSKVPTPWNVWGQTEQHLVPWSLKTGVQLTFINGLNSWYRPTDT